MPAVWAHNSPDLLPSPCYSLQHSLCAGDQHWYPPWKPPKQLWGALCNTGSSQPRNMPPSFPNVSPSRKGQTKATTKAALSAGSDERARSAFPLLSPLWQGRIQWKNIIIGPLQCFSIHRFTVLPSALTQVRRGFLTFGSNLLSLCTILIANALLF